MNTTKKLFSARNDEFQLVYDSPSYWLDQGYGGGSLSHWYWSVYKDRHCFYLRIFGVEFIWDAN